MKGSAERDRMASQSTWYACVKNPDQRHVMRIPPSEDYQERDVKSSPHWHHTPSARYPVCSASGRTAGRGACLGAGRRDGHADGREERQDGHVAGGGRAAREGHEVVPGVHKGQDGARQARHVAALQRGQHALPQRAQLLRAVAWAVASCVHANMTLRVLLLWTEQLACCRSEPGHAGIQQLDSCTSRASTS